VPPIGLVGHALAPWQVSMAAGRPGRELPSLQGAGVLLVEDDPDCRELLRYILKQQGAMVLSAASAEEALQIFDRDRPNVVVSDLGLPNRDGDWLIRQIRQRSPEQGGQTPAIAISAYQEAVYRSRLLLAGFQAFFAKPIDVDDLCTTVASLGG
jgi:CheY-like chemotaxis protein